MSRRETDHWTSHRRAAENEDIDFLIAAGVSIEEACRRVGVSRETCERRAKRAAQRTGAQDA